MMAEQTRKPSLEYRSRFDRWDTQAWVRTKPHQVAPFEEGLDFFSRDVSPLFLAPEVEAAAPDVQHGLLVVNLYDWLSFTEWLELGPVNEVCELIRRADFLPWIPQQMKADALKIYVDEGGHAEMSRALVDAVERETGIKHRRNSPAFLETLDRLVEVNEPELDPLIKLMFTIVSETLITGTLTKLPTDPRVQQAVRDLATDHASDEGRHHAYFRSLFDYVWPRLPSELQAFLGLLLPEMVDVFLRPQRADIIRMLSEFKPALTNINVIADGIVDNPKLVERSRSGAAPTIRMLANKGLLNREAIAAGFESRGLL